MQTEITLELCKWQKGGREVRPSHRQNSILVCETSSSFGASSLKNLSAVSGSHSLSEAVFCLSVSLLGLICSKHGVTPPIIFQTVDCCSLAVVPQSIATYYIPKNPYLSSVFGIFL